MKFEVEIASESRPRDFARYKLMKAEQGNFHASRFITPGDGRWGFEIRVGRVQLIVTRLLRARDYWRRFDDQGE